MKRYMPFVLVGLLAVFAAQASATNLLVNGNFASNDFTGWTISHTSNGTWGQGFPVVTGWPLGGENAAEGEVGEVNFTGQYEGGILSQTFTSSSGALTLSFDYAAMGDGIHNNSDGGLFELLLDGSVLAQADVGPINANQTITGSLLAVTGVTQGTHTFAIEVLRPFASSFQNTPYQFVTNADADGFVPEPGSLVLMASGVVGLAGVLRRKLF